MRATSRDTTGTTLEGEELPPEEDPHDPQADDKHHDDSSIYPITSKFSVRASFERGSGRHPFNLKTTIEIPFGVDNIPSERTNAAREDINRKVDWENPEIGVLGTVTFSEKDHVVKFHPEEERDTKTVGEWMIEQFFYMLQQANANQFTNADIPLSDVTDLQNIVHQNLPGEFITVEGECHNCGDLVRAETYASEGADEGFAQCDCGIGSSYPRVDDATADD